MNMLKVDKDIQGLPQNTYRNAEVCLSDKLPGLPSFSILDDGNQFVLDCLTSVEELRGIGKEWKHLEQTCGEPYIYFQSYDWCVKWCASFVDNAKSDKNQFQPQIKTYTLRRNGKLVLIWPMMLIKSTMDLVTQTFLSEPHGQYGNIICDRKFLPPKIGKKVWHTIKDTSNADAIILDQYPQSSFLRTLVQENGIVESSDKHSSALDLSAFGTWEEYHASQSRNMRKQRKQRRNKLSKLGILGYETHYGGSKRFAELVALGLEWKNIWLKQTGRRAAVLSDERTKDHLSSLTGTEGTQYDSPTGAIIGVLTLDEQPIALEIGLGESGRFYSYLGAFNWDFKSYSPGKLQIEETQKWAKAVGFKTFDFLGDPAEYKSAWTNSTDALESRSVAITARGFLYCVFWKAYLRPAVRIVFNKLKPEYRSKLLKLFGIGVKNAPKTQETPYRAVNKSASSTNALASEK